MKHGSNSTYQYRGCRCYKCREAHADYQRMQAAWNKTKGAMTLHLSPAAVATLRELDEQDFRTTKLSKAPVLLIRPK